MVCYYQDIVTLIMMKVAGNERKIAQRNNMDMWTSTHHPA